MLGLMWKGARLLPTAAAAGACAWGVLLLWGMTQGPILQLAEVLGGVLGGLPSAAVLAITLVLPALLCASAAVLAQSLRALGGAEKADA